MSYILCQCPSCDKQYYQELDGKHDEVPPVAYLTREKTVYALDCSYCARLRAAPLFREWAARYLSKGESEVPPKKKRRQRA